MPNGSIPEFRGARVTITCFIRDIVDGGEVEVERSVVDGWASLKVRDGRGLSFALSGDRSTLRMLLADALGDLTPDPDPDPEPPAEAAA